MKHLLTTFLTCLCVLTAQAAITMAQTYRVTSKKFTNKSLFVKDASIAANTDVVLWTETKVPAQQWTLHEVSDTTAALLNNYTSTYATASTMRAGGRLRMNRTTRSGGFVFEAVDEAAGIYRIMTPDRACCLSVTKGEDGEVPVWAAFAEGQDEQLWILEQVEPCTAFDAACRDEMVARFLSKYCTSRGSGMRTFVRGGWGEAEMLEVMLDAYESTGNEEYLSTARYVYSYFNKYVGSSWDKLVYTDDYKWYGHDFNDDVMWQIIAVARLGWLANNKTYTNAAKANFDKIYERAYIPFTGLMRWAQNSGDPYGTNSCIAGPTEVAACYLGMSGCGEEYFEKARDLYAAQRYVLANNMSTGKIWDSCVWDPATQKVKSKNEWASTYNQGTMLGAACLLYDHYGDEQYLKDAKKIMNFTKSDLCNSYGFIKVCQDEANGDLCGFKGILMRYVRRFVLDLCQPTFQNWLIDNAWLAYNNRNEQGLTGTGWLKKATTSSTTNPFGCSTAVSAGVNAVLGDVIKEGFATLQAERFDYHRGVVTAEEESCGGGAVIKVANGLWAQYDNVDFGEQTARSIAIDVAPPAGNATGTIEIYFDKQEGEPAGVVELKDLSGDAAWHTLRADITPTTGQHHLYLHFTCTTTRTKAYSVDQFTFSTQTTDGIQHPEQKRTESPAEFLDLSGRHMQAAPLHGPFIVRQGQRARVVIK